MKIKLYNSLNREISELIPINNDEVRIYSCGPTVYNFAHIGNMRAFLFADLLQRVIKVVGKYKMKWVMNITDIDDKTIRDSKQGTEAWLNEFGKQTDNPLENLKNLTNYYFEQFLIDINSLGIETKDFFSMPRATEYIPQMQELIKNIIKNDFAYISQGSIYFNVAKWRNHDVYGKLKHIDFDNFISGSRIDADEYEREQVSDFVLWKKFKDDEPSWDFDIDGENYRGRPGWHIECSAMGADLLGLPFDIHTGGVDLKFPHHEDEIAQSKAGYGTEPANMWCHNEFLEVEGKKMSKSLGNFFTIRDLTSKGVSAREIRFYMLATHYRTKFNFTFSGLEATAKSMKKVQNLICEINSLEQYGDIDFDIEQIKLNVFEELANDLHTPKALAVLFSFINNIKISEVSRKTADKLKEFFAELNLIFAVWDLEAKKSIDIPEDIVELALKRWEAKKNKEFALADELRKLIFEKGFTIKDAKDNYMIEIND